MPEWHLSNYWLNCSIYATHLQFGPRTSFWFRYDSVLVRLYISYYYPGLHTYGICVDNIATTTSTGEKVKQHTKAHRWGHWLEGPRREKVSLHPSRRFKMGKALNNHFLLRTWNRDDLLFFSLASMPVGGYYTTNLSLILDPFNLQAGQPSWTYMIFFIYVLGSNAPPWSSVCN